VIAGTNISNTFTSQQIISATSLLMSGGDILANGTVNIGTTGARLTDGYFTNIIAGTHTINDGVTTWRMALTGGNLVIANQLSEALASVQNTPKQWNWYGAMFPSATNTHALGSSSLVWNGLWSKSVDVPGTTSGSIYPMIVRDSGGAPGINFYRSTTIKAGSISSGATAALAVQDASDVNRLIVFQTGNVRIGGTLDYGPRLVVEATVTDGSAAVEAFSASLLYPSVKFNSCPVFSGAGSPEGVVTSAVCGMFLRTDGGAGTTLYIKQSGAGNTGWVGK
jgi:hypothetical protein